MRPEKGAAEMPLAAAVCDPGFYVGEWCVFVLVAVVMRNYDGAGLVVNGGRCQSL